MPYRDDRAARRAALQGELAELARRKDLLRIELAQLDGRRSARSGSRGALTRIAVGAFVIATLVLVASLRSRPTSTAEPAQSVVAQSVGEVEKGRHFVTPREESSAIPLQGDGPRCSMEQRFVASKTGAVDQVVLNLGRGDPAPRTNLVHITLIDDSSGNALATATLRPLGNPWDSYYVSLFPAAVLEAGREYRLLVTSDAIRSAHALVIAPKRTPGRDALKLICEGSVQPLHYNGEDRELVFELRTRAD